MIHELQSFAEELAAHLELSVELVCKRVTLDLFTRVTQRTPVDTGRARASWDVKIGSPSTFVPREKTKSVAGTRKTSVKSGLTGTKLGAGALTGGRTKNVGPEIAQIDGKQVIFITSSLDYMQYLEDGTSQQAPAGMITLSIAEIEAEIEMIIEQFNADS